MREPARLPDHVLGAVGEDLDAALRHFAWLDPREREGGRSGRSAGVDRALHLDQRAHAEAGLGEPAMRRGGIGHREGREMHAGMAREARIELAAERRVGGLEQHLDIAACEHGGDVAGAGRLRRAARGIGIDLDRHRRGRKAGACERACGGFRIAHEMADMVEENLVGDGELAVRLRPFALNHGALPAGGRLWPSQGRHCELTSNGTIHAIISNRGGRGACGPMTRTLMNRRDVLAFDIGIARGDSAVAGLRAGKIPGTADQAAWSRSRRAA